MVVKARQFFERPPMHNGWKTEPLVDEDVYAFQKGVHRVHARWGKNGPYLNWHLMRQDAAGERPEPLGPFWHEMIADGEPTDDQIHQALKIADLKIVDIAHRQK